MSKDYLGEVVYVVGGSMGIGLAAARQFAVRGAHVLTFARRREPLEEAVVDIQRNRRSRFSSTLRATARSISSDTTPIKRANKPSSACVLSAVAAGMCSVIRAVATVCRMVSALGLMTSPSSGAR